MKWKIPVLVLTPCICGAIIYLYPHMQNFKSFKTDLDIYKEGYKLTYVSKEWIELKNPPILNLKPTSISDKAFITTFYENEKDFLDFLNLCPEYIEYSNDDLMASSRLYPEKDEKKLKEFKKYIASFYNSYDAMDVSYLKALRVIAEKDNETQQKLYHTALKDKLKIDAAVVKVIDANNLKVLILEDENVGGKEYKDIRLYGLKTSTPEQEAKSTEFLKKLINSKITLTFPFGIVTDEPLCCFISIPIENKPANINFLLLIKQFAEIDYDNIDPILAPLFIRASTVIEAKKQARK